MSRFSWLKVSALTLALFAFGGVKSAQAQDWTDYLHWPYVPPQVPGNGFEYNGLYDGWYRYPREQRIVPQIQGPYYRNEYGGYRVFGVFRHPHGWHDWNKKRLVPGQPLTSWTSSEPTVRDGGTSTDHWRARSRYQADRPRPWSSSPSEDGRGLVVCARPRRPYRPSPSSTAIWK